jgi:hypothetical protein
VTQPASPSSAFFVSGGTLKPTAPSYVERAADQEFSERLLAGDFCYVLTSRQMGKSSLMARTAVKLRAAGTLPDARRGSWSLLTSAATRLGSRSRSEPPREFEAESLREVGLAASPVEHPFQRVGGFLRRQREAGRQRLGFLYGEVRQLDAVADVERRAAGVFDQLRRTGDAQQREGEPLESRLAGAGVVTGAEAGEEVIRERQTLAADPTRRRAFALGVVAMLLVLGPLGYWGLTRSEAKLDQALVQALLTARPEAVPNAIAKLQPFQARTLPQLRTEFDQAANSQNKLNAALALAAFGKVDVPFLLTSAAEAPPGQCMNIVRALYREKTSALAEIPRRIAQAKAPAARARLGTVALFLSDLAPLKELTLRNPDPTNRTASIHGYREWPGDPLQLATILQTVRTNSGLADFRSALCAALALVEWKTLAAPEQTALVKTLRQLYTESPDGGTHSAAACALTRWGQALPEPPAPTTNPPAGRGR